MQNNPYLSIIWPFEGCDEGFNLFAYLGRLVLQEFKISPFFSAEKLKQLRIHVEKH